MFLGIQNWMQPLLTIGLLRPATTKLTNTSYSQYESQALNPVRAVWNLNMSFTPANGKSTVRLCSFTVITCSSAFDLDNA